MLVFNLFLSVTVDKKKKENLKKICFVLIKWDFFAVFKACLTLTPSEKSDNF